ncbi:Na+/H+ antiporter subunit C [Oceanobacter mangrovi]|uniref:Na+/H+ antiporter subunit C n=1 Tax=Oceanobacter mangrovi TaxID=2862510 RepID=UPI001C8D5087|nr:Na+/H+ antiporter subunit C [Oceanobacter mangrovi]
MEFSFAIAVGFLTAAGVFLMLRGQTFPVILGLTLLSYATNLFLFASGRLVINGAAILGSSENYTDPLPQALVLTAIVIGFAMTAFVIILAIRARTDLGNDQVDGRESALDISAEYKSRKERRES